MKQIITDIEERLADQVPELKYIAQDWGQLDLYADFPPVKFPCALVDITDGSFSNAGHSVQEGQLNIVITIADLSNRVSRNATDDMKKRAMQIFDLLEAVYVALQGWSGGQSYAKLSRTSTSRQTREDGARLRTLVFSTTWWDQSADKRQYAPVNRIGITQSK